jgi:hypothetical protein
MLWHDGLDWVVAGRDKSLTILTKPRYEARMLPIAARREGQIYGIFDTFIQEVTSLSLPLFEQTARDMARRPTNHVRP